VDSKELVNLYLDISDGLLSKLSLNNSTEGNFDKYLFVLALEQSLDSLAVSIASSSEFENPKFSSYDYINKWRELSIDHSAKNIIKKEFSSDGVFNMLILIKKAIHEPINELIIVSNETLSLKKFNLLLDRYKEFIIMLRKTLEEC
tara:strand:+ start:1361 stop:1798 length:438 start_codon:yes stop_codon:yes gene_type:complete